MVSIWDTFMFRNEFDVLRIRLEELWDVVDTFVLVEADCTHRGNPKAMEFTQQQDRFARYASRLRVVRVEDCPRTGNAWVRENFQRNAILRGLAGAQPEDVVLISDVDEIPRTDLVRELGSSLPAGEVLAFQQLLHYYSLNWRVDTPWFGTRAVRRATLDTLTPQDVRLGGTLLAQDGGWHFSYLAPQDEVVEALIEKVKAFAHAEYDTEAYLDRDYLRSCIRQGYSWCDDGTFSSTMTHVPIGATHPLVVQRRAPEFAHLVSDVPDPTLPPPTPRSLATPHAWQPVYDTPTDDVPVDPAAAPAAPDRPTPAAAHCPLCGRLSEEAGSSSSWRCACGHRVRAAGSSAPAVSADDAARLLSTTVQPLLRNAPTARVLDVSAGHGTFVAVARGAGLDCTGIETDRTAVARAGADGIPVLLGAVASLPPGGYDLATVWGAADAAADPVALLREVTAVLVPGGRLVVRTDDGSGDWLVRALRLAGLDEPVLLEQDGGPVTLMARAPRRGALAAPPPARSGARPPVSVVTCVWNAADTTDAFLTLLQGVLAPDDEVIVVDNGSTDGTASVLERHSWVRVVRHDTNEGFARGANAGAAHAQHDVVLFLDNDTIPVPGLVERLLAPFEDPAVAATGPLSNRAPVDQLVSDPTYRPVDLSDVVQQAGDVARWGAGRTRPTASLSGSFLAVRRVLLECVDGFDERFPLVGSADEDLGLRLTCAGWTLLVVSDAFVHHVGQVTLDANGVDRDALQQANGDVLTAKVDALPLVTVVVAADDQPLELARTLVDVADELAGLPFETVVVTPDTAALAPVLDELAGRLTVVEAPGTLEELWQLGCTVGSGLRRALVAAGEQLDPDLLTELLATPVLDAAPTRCGAVSEAVPAV